MQMFIANCTMQTRIINYRLPEVSRNIQQTIAPLGQVRVGRSQLSQPDIDSIVEQLGRYGLANARNLSERKNPTQQVPIVYMVDATVPEKLIRQVHAHNKGTLRKLGEKTRTEAAIASSTFMENSAPNTLRTQEVSIMEESAGTLHTDADMLSAGTRVLGSRATEEDRKPRRRGNGS